MDLVKKEIDWLTDALSTKNIAREMTHYRVGGREIKATDGRITAGHPWPTEDQYLVPGTEFEKIVRRMPGDPRVEVEKDHIKVVSGRSRGAIRTMPLEQWDYPGVDTNAWTDLPEGLIGALRALRPFVSDNATHAWSLGVALDDGWAYATNNIVLAGVRLPSLDGRESQSIVPVWAIDFIVDRAEDLVEWAWTEYYIGFRWKNGAWMRSQLIEGTFHERASEMIRNVDVMELPQPITKEFKSTFARAAPLVPAGSAIKIARTWLRGAFDEAQFEEGVEVETLDDAAPTSWTANRLAPVIEIASEWEPATWSKPTFFKGEGICGIVLGRNE